MRIKNLRLINFRNYLDERFDYNNGLNVICGKNAQGKTNSAEALFMLATGFSPRAKNDSQLIRYGEKYSLISAEAETLSGTVDLKIEFFADSKKKITLNGVQLSKVGELFGNIRAVFFNPDDLKLIKEAPEDRRRFLDVSLSQINKRYFYELVKYKKILLQRNNLLKNHDKQLIFETLPIWDEQLAASASELIYFRNNFLLELAPIANKMHAYITDGLEKMTVLPSKNLSGEKEEIKKMLTLAYNESLEKDIALGFTTIGPHRDDLKITINGKDVKTYGSQGQQRTAALSLKLSELEIFKQHFGEYPLLILDDAMSELDLERQRKLLSKIKDIQTVITCTEPNASALQGFTYRLFEISGGEIIK